MELLLGLVLSLTAAVVGVWHVTSRDRPIHGPRDDGTLGLPHLQHWSERHKRPRFQNLRRNLPLVEISRVVVALVIVIVLVGTAFFAYSYWSSREVRSQKELTARLEDIETLHARANAATDTPTAVELLRRAQGDLDALIAGADESILTEDVFAAQDAIDQDIRELTKLYRVDTAQLLGSVPNVADDTPVRLIQGGGKIYLLAGSFYEVDTARSTLVELLKPGAVVDGAAVGNLLAATWREDGPLVVDEAAAYVFDRETGQWLREALGPIDGGGLPSNRAVDVYDFNLYALDTNTGAIFKYTGGDYTSPPEHWTQGLDVQELTTAVDIAVDGSIFALLGDGRILSLFLNAVDQVLEPPILPPFEAAKGLTFGSEKRYLYLLNEDGRIARITREGVLIQQFETSESAPDFAGLREIVVDEASGIAYALVENLIYAVRLPNAPEVDDDVE